jgi:hypothetical protein
MDWQEGSALRLERRLLPPQGSFLSTELWGSVDGFHGIGVLITSLLLSRGTEKMFNKVNIELSNNTVITNEISCSKNEQ